MSPFPYTLGIITNARGFYRAVVAVTNSSGLKGSQSFAARFRICESGDYLAKPSTDEVFAKILKSELTYLKIRPEQICK